MEGPDAKSRRAMRDVASNLYSLDQVERDQLRALLDRVDEELAPPEPEPPPEPFAMVESPRWQTNDSHGIRRGNMPEFAATRFTDYSTLAIGNFGNNNLRVSLANLAVDVQVNGKGELAVWWLPGAVSIGRTRIRDNERTVIWRLPFDHVDRRHYRLQSTSLPGDGYVVFLLRALPPTDPEPVIL